MSTSLHRMETYQPISPVFRDAIAALVAGRKYVRVYYFTDLHELLSVQSVLKDIRTDHTGEYLLLASGEAIRLDQVVNLDGIQSPGYDDYDHCMACRADLR